VVRWCSWKHMFKGACALFVCNLLHSSEVHWFDPNAGHFLLIFALVWEIGLFVTTVM
jgi:hypothetical protein